MQADNPHAPTASRRACGAKKRDGTPCPTPPMANGRCRMHGGATPVGPALPQFRHGRYSKYLPERLAERYQASLEDSELLGLRDELGLVDARIADLLERVGFEAAWPELSALLQQRLRLAEAERRRLAEAAQTIPVREALAFVARVADAVKRHVTDPRQLAALYRDLAALTNRPVQELVAGGADAGGERRDGHGIEG
jgi:hypothetical protein